MTSRRLAFVFGAAGLTAAIAAACSANTTSHEFQPSATSTGAGGSGGGGLDGGKTVSSSSGLGGMFVVSVTSSSTGGAPCVPGPMDQDQDHDGYTPAEGDCDDCNPAVNPAALDVPPMPDGDGGMTMPVDANCDGQITFPTTCDDTLALDDTNAMDGAKAIDLCQTAGINDKTWGVLQARYVRADGSPIQLTTAEPQVGLQQAFGPNVNPQAGKTMLLLSAGTARTPGQAGACGTESCSHTPPAGNPPAGFPAVVPGCAGESNINDDVGLELAIRAPSNATGYKFNFKFYSFEFPVFVCTSYNDQFIALVQPAPLGAMNGNIAFDANSNPVSVNIGFFDVCDPASISNYSAPNPPNPYCPSGPAQLQGTGFDTWGGETNSGATSWLETQAPVKGSEEFDVRFAIWNTGDEALFSSVLVDNWQWILTPGVSVATDPETNPK